MKITNLSVYRYKSFLRPFILENPGKLHFFIGPNNSGKTNILDAIEQIFNNQKSRLIDNQTKLYVSFKYENHKIEVKQSRGKKEFFLDTKKINPTKAINILSSSIIRLSATSPVPFKKLVNDFIEFKEKYPREFYTFKKELKKHIPKVSIAEKFLDNFALNFKESNHPVLYERMGDGFRQVFVILFYLFNPKYRILLLEEPEIHLHPALIKKLCRLLEDEKFQYQIFLTTHSPLFIHNTNLHRLFRVVKKQGSTIVYSPRLVGKQLDYSRLKQELNAENTEMFFAEEVLLVEGPSDHLLMRGLIDRFYNGDKDIKVIQVYGKSNMDIYAELLQVFRIPHFVLMDRDALYDTGIKILDKRIKRNFGSPEWKLIEELKKDNIFILPNGSIEKNYPKKYQRIKKHKPQNALYASTHITEQEYNSPRMKNLKEIIDKL